MRSRLLFFGRILFIFSVIALYSSCSLFDTSEKIPSYIHIDKVNFIPGDTSVQGTASVKISDAWVFIDDQLVGAYELPATFPVQYDGTHTIKVRGGVKMNGISATRIQYPFYNFYSTQATLEPKKTITINPTAAYF